MTSRLFAVATLAAFLALVGVAIGKSKPRPEPVAKRVVGYGQIRYGGMGPEKWAQRWRAARRHELELELEVSALRSRLKGERRVMMHDPHVVEAINLACATFGYCSTLWRKAKCETGGSFSPTSYNASGASGLFQFLPSTWRSTPFRVFSIFSPYASALAAGWMHEHGRGGEWSCQ